MKCKNIIIVLLMVLMFSVSGCTVKKEDISEIKEDVKEVVVENKLSELVPDPEDYFFNSEFEMVTTDNSYIVYLDHVSEEEWDSYVSKCELDDYWVDEEYRSERSWYVNSKDNKYKLMLDRYGENHDNMTIIIKIKEEEE